MSPEIIILLMFVIFTVGLFAGYPVVYVLGATGIAFGVFEWGPLSFEIFAMQVFGVMGNTILMAIPLFILMANFLVHSGISDRLFSATPYLFGPMNGGMGVSVIIICTLMAACTGIVGAAVTSMGLTALPVMLEHKYNKQMSLGIVAAGGTLGVLIPPSIMLVIIAPYASISVGKIFAGAMLPGLLLATLYTFYVAILCWIRPDFGPGLSKEQRGTTSIMKRIGIVFVNATPTLMLIIGVLGSILMGITTVTEAAAAGAFLSFLLVIIYRRFSWITMKTIIISTAKTSTMILVILVAASCFTTTLFGLGGKEIISNFFLSFEMGKWWLITVVFLSIFLMGFILDWVEILPIVFPIFLPIVTHVGFDPLWFCVMVAIVLQTAYLTPPFGPSLFYLKGVAPENCTMVDIILGIWPFCLIVLIGALLCTVFPIIVTWLPSHLFG